MNMPRIEGLVIGGLVYLDLCVYVGVREIDK